MKTRYWLIICFVCFLIGNGGWALIDYYLFPCKGTFVFQWEGPTTKTVFKSVDPGCVRRDIEIIGRQREKLIDIQASDGCKTATRTMSIDIKPYYPKWSLQFGIIGGAGYNNETKKADGIIGIDGALYRHFKRHAIGGGAWYMQNIYYNFKAGGIKVNYLFSFGKQ